MLSFALVVPSIAQGIGAIGVVINATDSASSPAAAFCLNISLVF